jgi:Flp pilus assembly protein TadD
MSLAQALDSDLESALRTAEEGVQLYAHHPALRNNYGVLLELMGDLERSEQVIREADAGFRQLYKEMAWGDK